ncbi:hypothetical protein B296_00006034 [Ensete ventricosum]|uniref:Uncharacterized protein n=1 Tax=Ensete ventricosum TaxID=4639 RepID=A0A426ZKY3_ENSVE|nr:hypothetical protein B296_00006034 [Ensete ventricosum]
MLAPYWFHVVESAFRLAISIFARLTSTMITALRASMAKLPYLPKLSASTSAAAALYPHPVKGPLAATTQTRYGHTI